MVDKAKRFDTQSFRTLFGMGRRINPSLYISVFNFLRTKRGSITWENGLLRQTIWNWRYLLPAKAALPSKVAFTSQPRQLIPAKTAFISQGSLYQPAKVASNSSGWSLWSKGGGDKKVAKRFDMQSFRTLFGLGWGRGAESTLLSISLYLIL